MAKEYNQNKLTETTEASRERECVCLEAFFCSGRLSKWGSNVDKQELVSLKAKLKRKAKALDMNLFGVADVARWESRPIYGTQKGGAVTMERKPITPKEYWPQTIWPWARRVIVMGVQIFPSMIETTPSVVYSELYNTTNRFLDEAAYRIANVLNEQGFRAHFFPRDCYGDISVLVKKPEAAFSQVLAGLYAGLGTIGMNHTLLTPEYGPRVRLVSVITDAEIPADRMLKKELCIHCRTCVRRCPMQAFTPLKGQTVVQMDKFKCAGYHQQIKNEFRYPCGLCTAVCPVGADKKRWGASAVSAEGIAHCQNFGSKNAVE